MSREERAGSEGAVDVAVVGGGLAGLSVGALLARAGLDVTVSEMKCEVGGRARTSTEEGYAFNVGPHALYSGGSMAELASDVGVELSGAPGPTWNGWAEQDGSLFRLPASVPSLLATSGLGWREKLEVGRLLAGLRRVDPADHSGAPIGDWIDRRLDSPRSRSLLRALVRLTTYCPDDDLDAGAALGMLQKGTEGALYLDGGWQTLVDGLRRAVLESGGRLRTNRRLEEVHWGDARAQLHPAEDPPREARHVVLAVRPAEAARIAEPTPPSLERAARDARAVRVASLDLGLERRPSPNRALVLGLDKPLYLSDHAGPADLAPGNGALVHAVRYLGGRTPRPDEDLQRIEAFMDRVHPGWRDRVAARRFLPGATVAHDVPLVESGGLTGRYGPDVPEAGPLFVAGDWVGSEGMLSDAAAASARSAAQRIAARHEEVTSTDAELGRAV